MAEGKSWWNPEEAWWLPPGSVRASIAWILIGVIAVIILYRTFVPLPEGMQAAPVLDRFVDMALMAAGYYLGKAKKE